MEITYFKRHWPREKNLYNQVNPEPRTKNQESRIKNQESRKKTENIENCLPEYPLPIAFWRGYSVPEIMFEKR